MRTLESLLLIFVISAAQRFSAAGSAAPRGWRKFIAIGMGGPAGRPAIEMLARRRRLMHARREQAVRPPSAHGPELSAQDR